MSAVPKYITIYHYISLYAGIPHTIYYNKQGLLTVIAAVLAAVLAAKVTGSQLTQIRSLIHMQQNNLTCPREHSF
jgi:hypothetical protein